MTGIEEMTRRRDAWRTRAESAADEIRALRLTHERDGEALAREKAHSASLARQLKEAKAEAAAHLQWVRTLQKDVEHWKLNSKTLATAFMRQGRVTAWLGPISLCPTRHASPRSCIEPRHTHLGCFAHWHCDMCGAVRCHDLWWRSRRRPL